MKKLNEKLKVSILAIVLIAVSITCIMVCGKTYTYKIAIMGNVTDLDSISISIEDGNNTVQITDKSLRDGKLYLTLMHKNAGKTYISIVNEAVDQQRILSVYAHKTGILTAENYFGSSTGDIVVPVSILIFSAYLLYTLVTAFIKSKKQSLCQYKNIALLGLIIFIAAAFIYQLTVIFNYQGISHTISTFTDLFSAFSIILLPVAIVVSVFVITSNLVLVRREGFTLRNLLGVFLGGLVCVMTILPSLLYSFLYMSPLIDIHNTDSIYMYIHLFFEFAAYTFVAYLECILIATIIISYKAATSVPRFNKDYILILGCQIKEDGTLTRLLQNRVDRAIEFYNMQKEKTGKELIFVPSGGQGNDEIIAEADAIKNYLIDKGFPNEKILVENKSTNTEENISFSYMLIKEQNKNAEIAFSTTNYHVFRAGAIAYKQNVRIEGIGAKTKAYFWINAFIREFIAAIVSEKKKHLFVFLIILLLSILCVIFSYYSFNI